jgi:N-acetylmuramoyl-L-alanine amidase
VLPTATPVEGTTVVLDPGHGGWDPGAVGFNGLTEAELNLAVSKEAQAALERAGVSAALTHADNHGMNLPNRAKVAQGLGAKVFVSVHHNAAAWARSPIPGSDVYYQERSDDSKRLGGILYEEIVAALTPYAVPWVSIDTPGVTFRTRARDGDDWYAMVRLPKPIPAALAELAYLSNPPEAALLARPDVQRVEGEAVARGIERYLTTHDPGSGFVTPYPRTEPAGGPGPATCRDPAL